MISLKTPLRLLPFFSLFLEGEGSNSDKLKHSALRSPQASGCSCRAGFRWRWSLSPPETYPPLRLGGDGRASKATQITSPRQEFVFFGQHLSRDYWPPGHKNPAVGFFWGVDHHYVDGEPFKKKTFFDIGTYVKCSKKELAKTRENLHRLFWTFGSLSQSIGRGRLISREGALDVRKSRERRDKIVPIFSPEKQEKRNFCLFFPAFLSRIACCARESTSVTESPTKTAKKEEEEKMGPRFFYRGRAQSRFQWDFFIIFLAAEKLILGGGVIISKQASH